jgi:hypothetical protein
MEIAPPQLCVILEEILGHQKMAVEGMFSIYCTGSTSAKSAHIIESLPFIKPEALRARMRPFDLSCSASR